MTNKERKVLVGMIAVAVGVASVLIALGKSATEVVTGAFVTWCALGTFYFLAVTLRFYSAKKNH